MEILNEKEIVAVEKFVADKVAFEAVRKVLLAGIYNNGVLKPGEKADPAKNFALFEAFNYLNQGVVLSDADLGQIIKAKAQGIKLLEMAFSELERMKVEKPKDKPVKSNIAL